MIDRRPPAAWSTYQRAVFHAERAEQLFKLLHERPLLWSTHVREYAGEIVASFDEILQEIAPERDSVTTVDVNYIRLGIVEQKIIAGRNRLYGWKTAQEVVDYIINMTWVQKNTSSAKQLFLEARKTFMSIERANVPYPLSDDIEEALEQMKK